MILLVMVENIVTVTKKGQATIPKVLRDKHKIGKKALAVDTEEGVLLKPVPDPLMEKGSLKGFFSGKTSRQLIGEARTEEAKREKRLLRKGGKLSEHST
jgi:bifunctional DNA-binding transcriptional regulator/antitoxin component of YhaV-PrlF toxin-antitoxin module